jgi:hypothetical protein
VKQYFAKRSAEELVDECRSYSESWFSILGSADQGLAAVWNRNFRYYYNNFISGSGYDSSLEFGGEQGELVKMGIPQARSLNQQLLSLVTKQRLNFTCEAETTDYLTMADTKIGDALTKQVTFTQDLDAKAWKMCEHTTMTGLGYMGVFWDMTKGKPKTANGSTGELLYTGDLNVTCILPTDIIFDFTKENFKDLDWVIVRVIRNKYDLIAMHPEKAETINALPSVRKLNDVAMFWDQQYNDDYVYTFEFYHRSTPALPQGRMTVFGDKNTILYDTIDFEEGNPYKDFDGNAYIPVVQMKPEPVVGTGFGYPIFCNLLPMQEMLDFNFSAIASNNSANAVQTVANPIGNDVGVKMIGGLRFIQYKPMNAQGGGKPEPLQLTQSSPESYKFSDMLRAYMMEVYNINSALRGTPPPGVTAGNALATLTTNAIEFTQSFSKAYVTAVETVMTYAVWNYRNFCDEDMIISIAGSRGTTLARTFKREDIGNLKRVRCEIANPLMATAAGKFEVAQQLLQTGLITNPKAYFRILEGAPLEALYDDEESQEELIEKENDDLRTGKKVYALWVDDHPAHMKAHRAILNDPEIRRNSTAVSNILAHIEEHDRLDLESDPRLQQIFQTGQPAPKPQMPPPGQAPMPGLPQSGGPQPAEPAEPSVDISQIPVGGVNPPGGM